MKKILVIGAGSWGTALANTLAYNNKNVFLWTEKQKISDQINKTKINKKYFKKMQELNKFFNLKELSMGMSQDYLDAINYGSTYVRIGSNIFGRRS